MAGSRKAQGLVLRAGEAGDPAKAKAALIEFVKALARQQAWADHEGERLSTAAPETKYEEEPLEEELVAVIDALARSQARKDHIDAIEKVHPGRNHTGVKGSDSRRGRSPPAGGGRRGEDHDLPSAGRRE